MHPQQVLATKDRGTDLSIVLINWNSREFLRQCLFSIYANPGDLRLEVLVVDNASYDGTPEMLGVDFPQVHFIQSHKNLGFAMANNLGFSHSSGRHVLFLNPDTRILGSALARLSSALDDTSDAGIVGARILNDDSSLQTSCVQAFPSIWNQVLDSDAFRHLFPKSSLWGTRVLFEDVNGPTAVDAISGACLMIKRDVFLSIGMFSHHYFMYSEDIDLCFTVAQAGWKNYYVGDATVIHYGGRSSAAAVHNNFAVVMTRASMQTFFELRRGWGYAILYRVCTGFAALLRLIVIAGFVVLPGGIRDAPHWRLSLAKWRSVLRWSIGFERWSNELYLTSRSL